VKAVHTELHRSHDPQFFLVRGVIKRTTEQPERADRLLAGLKAGKHNLVEPIVFGQGPRTRVHSVEYLSFLAEAWEAWSALGVAGGGVVVPVAWRVALVVAAQVGLTVPDNLIRLNGAEAGRTGWPSLFASAGVRARF